MQGNLKVNGKLIENVKRYKYLEAAVKKTTLRRSDQEFDKQEVFNKMHNYFVCSKNLRLIFKI